MTSHPLRLIFLKRILAVAGLAVSFAALTGCNVLPLPGAPAEPVASYARGDLEVTMPADSRKVIDAAKGALGDLNFGLISENREATRVVLISRTPGDKKIEIDIGNTYKTLTGIKIRVGMFGDEQVSRKIFDRIKARL